MKRSFYTIGSVIVLLISAFIFVLLPAMVGGSGRTKFIVGKYDGKEIRYEQGSDFANYLAQYTESERNRLQQYGAQPDSSTYFNGFTYAFNTVVTKMAYETAVRKSGWKPSASVVNRNMVSNFLDENRNYSPKLFKQASEEAKATLENNIKENLISSRYYEDNFGSFSQFGKYKLFGLKHSAAETDFLASLGTEAHSFDMVSFSMTNYPESEIKAYGKEHENLFVAYDMSIITVPSKDEAQKVLDRLNKNDGITFKDAVTEYSKRNYSGDEGKLNNKYNYQLKAIISEGSDLDAVTSLAVGQLSSVVKTSTGYSIFKCDSESTKPNFEDSVTINTVYNYIKNNEMGRIEDYFTGIAQTFVSTAALKGFDTACEQQNLTKVSVPAFPLNYNNVTLADSLPSEITAISSTAATNEHFLRSAFALKQDEVSEPIVLGQNVIVLKMTGTVEKTADDVTIIKNDLDFQIPYYDMMSAQTAVLSSPKVENHVAEVFFKNFLTN
ncbi:MAG: peptidyl-prolyl cis-trans isomerase [Treponema sp.]|nr:peptidyl-prolyl cis-trans isomerase [Treponema sp.]